LHSNKPFRGSFSIVVSVSDQLLKRLRLERFANDTNNNQRLADKQLRKTRNYAKPENGKNLDWSINFAKAFKARGFIGLTACYTRASLYYWNPNRKV